MGTAEAIRKGAMTLLLRGGKGASRTEGSLPHAQNIPGFHWSPEANLMETNPAMYGRGIKGAEASRLEGAGDVRPRTYFYTDEASKEGGLGAHQYKGDLKNVYPKGDPLGLMKEAKGDATDYERLLKKAGYKGYEGSNAVVYFDRVPVAKHTKGTAAPAPSEAKPMLTDTTEVRAGSRTGHMQGLENNEEYQNKLMAWLENSNKAYPKLGLQGESKMTTGVYTPPGGVTERNPLNAYSIPYSPEAEEAVDTYGTLRNVLLGQNARGYSGVKEGASGAGLRLNMGGQNQQQIEQMIAELDKRGSTAIPTGEGLNVINFGGRDVFRDAHRAAKRAGIPKAEGYQGDPVSAYTEFDWSRPGQGDITREHIIPKLLRDPDLTRRLDLTGEPQQLSRGLNAADSAAASRHGVQAREDIQSLRSTIAQQGLRGLLERVAEKGYTGLPAAGVYALPDQEGR
jgi:hypothetical protein